MLMVLNIASIIIAISSFLLSIYVVRKDRKDKMFENLLACRQRILDIFNQHEVLTVDQMVDYFEENPVSDDAVQHKAKSQDLSTKVEREFEFACYLVSKRQIDLYPFFDIFKRWLAGRLLTFNQHEYMKTNLSYTWGVIQLCIDKKLLPLKGLKPIS